MSAVATERPIIFSGPMVRAILDGRKTQTRRVVKLNLAGRVQLGGRQWHPNDEAAVMACPYGQPGDRLWVRETHRTFGRRRDGAWEGGMEYRADMAQARVTDPGHLTAIRQMHKLTGLEGFVSSRWRPSIHMPRWASRITLEVTEVRVERVQEITNDDVAAEGAAGMCAIHPGVQHTACSGLRPGFRKLWDEINAKRGFGWDENPWVWVVGFRLLEGA